MALEHAAPAEVVSLPPLGQDITDIRSAALVKTDAFETIRLVVPAGSVIPPHKVAGHLTLHCLEGEIVLEAGHDIAMRAGDWLYLDPGTVHAVRGIANASLLLTILFDR